MSTADTCPVASMQICGQRSAMIRRVLAARGLYSIVRFCDGSVRKRTVETESIGIRSRVCHEKNDGYAWVALA